jgi:hypothetical protein
MEHVIPYENCRFNCFQCHKKIEYKYDQILFMETNTLLTESGGKVTGFVEQRMKKLGKEDGLVHSLTLGQPLPMNGACQHQKKINKWLRYPCCGKMYSCGKFTLILLYKL